MLSFISWQQYLLAVGAAGFFYYLVVFLRYYRADLRAFRRNAVSPMSPASPDPVMGEARPDLREVFRSAPELPGNHSDEHSPKLN